MRCVPVFHDAIKCGWNGSLHTVHEHPMLAAEWVKNTKVENDIPSEYKEMIAGMCEAHSGEWTTNRRSSVVLPEPRNDMELFIHECDILSSRSDLDMIIPNSLKNILFSANTTENEEVIVEYTLEYYHLGFGRHSGKTLLEIKECDPSYIKWMKNNIEDERIRTLLAQM